MKKFIHLFLLALLSACAGAPAMEESLPTPSAEKGILVWVQSTKDVTGLQILLDDYSRQTGEQVSLVSPLDDTQIASALTGEVSPDVLVLDGVEMVRYYTWVGYLKAITGVSTESMLTAPLNQCQIDGTLYCLPWTTNFYTLYWNKVLFEVAGLDPESRPQTLEQLTEYADQLTRFGLEGQLDQVGFLPDKITSHLWIYTYLQGGFWYSSDLSHLTVNSQSVQDALLWESQFYTKYDSELVRDFQAKKGENPFIDGSVALLIAPAGLIFPEDMNIGAGLIPFPGDALEKTGTFLFGGKMIVTPKTADSQNVKRFLEWMISPEISAQVACNEKDFPANHQGLRDPCFSDRFNVEDFVPMLESTIGYVRLSTPASSELETVLSQVEEQVLSSGTDPGPLLEQIQGQLEVKFQEMMNK